MVEHRQRGPGLPPEGGTVVRQHPTKMTEMSVTIVGSSTTTGKIMCRNAYGDEFEIDGTVRRKGTGFPMPGERWFLIRKGNVWIPDVQIGAPGVGVITGSRDGLHPVMAQVLDEMARQGLVLDQTIAPLFPILDDTVDPADLSDYPVSDDDDGDEDILEPDDPGEVPPNSSGPGKKDPTSDPAVVTGPWTPLFLGTYNIKFTLGPARAKQDLVKLSQTKLQVLGLEEMGHAERGPVLARLEDLGWDTFRPTNVRPESNIAWRADEFVKLDSGAEMLSAGGISHAPVHRGPRFMSWVKLRQKASGRTFYFITTHTHPHIEGHNHWHQKPFSPGHPSSDPNLKEFMDDTYEELDRLVQVMKQWGAHVPVFTVADWNIDFFADRRVRDPRFPYRRFKEIGAYANFDLINHHPNYGTHGKRTIDYLYVTKPKEYQVRLLDHWILTGYHSDHRPVIVQTAIHNKSRPATSGR